MPDFRDFWVNLTTRLNATNLNSEFEAVYDAANEYTDSRTQDASNTVKGVVTLSTAPSLATSPIAVGDNDPRNTNARTPTAHTHPQSDVTNLTTDLAGKAATGDTRFPTTDEKAALAGTNGVISTTNRYVTNSDPRNTNARTPTAHTHPQSDITNLATDLAAKRNRISYQAPAFAATFTPDPNLGEIINVGALTGNITIAAVTAPITGRQMTIILTQDGAGGRTVTWDAAYSVITPLATAANARTAFDFVYNGTTWLEI